MLFTTINKWEKKTGLSSINVSIVYTLKSAKTGEILFERDGDLSVSFSSGSGGILSMALDMLSTALTDHVVAARKCNRYVIQDMPEGKYGLNYLQDGGVAVEKPKLKGNL